MVSLRECDECFYKANLRYAIKTLLTQMVGVCQLEHHLVSTMFSPSTLVISYEECFCVLGL